MLFILVRLCAFDDLRHIYNSRYSGVSMARSLSALILVFFVSAAVAAVPVTALVVGAVIGYLGGSAIGMARTGDVQDGSVQTTAPIPVPGGSVNAPVALPVNKQGIADMFKEHMNNGGFFTPQGRQIFCDWLGPGYVCGSDGLYVPVDPPPEDVSPSDSNDYFANLYSGSYDGRVGYGPTPESVCKGIWGGAYISAQMLPGLNHIVRCHRYMSNGVATTTDAELTWKCLSGGTLDIYADPVVCKNAPSCDAGTVRYTDGVCRSGVPETRPATDQDYDNLPEIDDDTAQQILDSGTPLPVGKPDPRPFSEPLGPPYPAPTAENPKRYKQDVINGTPIGSSGNTVIYNITTTTIINNNYNPATDGPNLPGVDPSDPAPEDMQEEPKDPCMENPNRLSCIEGGEPPDVPDLEREEVPININPVSMGSGFCPANKTASFMGKSLTISWAPICDGAIMMRPVVIAIAWLSAALIVVGAFRE